LTIFSKIDPNSGNSLLKLQQHSLFCCNFDELYAAFELIFGKIIERSLLEIQLRIFMVPVFSSIFPFANKRYCRGASNVAKKVVMVFLTIRLHTIKNWPYHLKYCFPWKMLGIKVVALSIFSQISAISHYLNEILYVFAFFAS